MTVGTSPAKESTPSVVVAVPVYKPEMTVYEAFSLQRCAEVLGRYPICLFGPDDMDFSAYTKVTPGAAVERFPPRFFVSVQSYSDLLLTASFYERFQTYEFMLIYQLDAFVFYDALGEWCARGYDYVGAPWRECAHTGGQPCDGFYGVGNGGFSLRRVSACLKLLRSSKKEDPVRWRQRYAFPACNRLLRVKLDATMVLKYVGVCRQSVASYLRGGYHGEDFFWGLDASRFDSGFAVAPVAEAVYFSFETDLEAIGHLYEHRLPFGCHAPWNVRVAYQYLVEGVRPGGAYNEILCEILRRAEVAQASRRTV